MTFFLILQVIRCKAYALSVQGKWHLNLFSGYVFGGF